MRSEFRAVLIRLWRNRWKSKRMGWNYQRNKWVEASNIRYICNYLPFRLTVDLAIGSLDDDCPASPSPSGRSIPKSIASVESASSVIVMQHAFDLELNSDPANDNSKIIYVWFTIIPFRYKSSISYQVIKVLKRFQCNKNKHKQVGTPTKARAGF